MPDAERSRLTEVAYRPRLVEAEEPPQLDMVASQGPGISSAIVHVPAKIGMPDLDICIIDAAICLGYLPSLNPAAGSTPTKLYRDSPALSSALPDSSLYNLRQETKDAPRISHMPFTCTPHFDFPGPCQALVTPWRAHFAVPTPQLSDARRFQCRSRCCFSCRFSGHYCCLVGGAAVTPHCLPAIAVLHRTLPYLSP